MDWGNWRVHYRRLALHYGLKFNETGNSYWMVYNDRESTGSAALNFRGKKHVGISLANSMVNITSGEYDKTFNNPTNDKDYETIKKILEADEIVMIDGKPHAKVLKEVEL